MRKSYILFITSIILLLILVFFIWGKLLFVNCNLINTDQNESVRRSNNIKNELKEQLRLDWADWAAKFESINKILDINVYNIVVNTYENKKCGMNRMKRIENIDLKIENTNFSDEDGRSQDYFITVEIKSDWWKDDALIILVFTNNDGKYELVYQYLHGLAKPINVSLMDIDTDTTSEIVIEEDFSGNQAIDNAVRILKYTGSGFVTIFEEGLFQCCDAFPYFYDNKYQFVRNNGNPKLLDIVFTIKTNIDKDLMNEFTDDFEFPEPINDEVVFIFDGEKYSPNKGVYDYRKLFKEYFQ